MKSTSQRTAYIVSHTHWDREWRQPIWGNRILLCKFMDEMVEMLESGKYPGFLLDGQVSPVLDYLETRPEMAARIKNLVTSQKLQIGPWLTLPDFYPVDGEAILRNLLWGRRQSQELGDTFNVAYTPCGWGQSAQLPQIYAGFGIEIAMIGKKVSDNRAPNSEFIWRGPDGTEIMATRFGGYGRANFYFKMHLSALYGVYHEGPDWIYKWGKGGLIYHRADEAQMEQEMLWLNAPDHWHPEIITPELVEETWRTTDPSVLDDCRLMMNGCDYTASQLMMPEMIKRINDVDKNNNRQWVHTTMPHFIELMKKKIDRSKLAVVEGELRDGPIGEVTGNALSTRLYLKRLNKHAQNMLIRYAEPLSVVAAMAGAEFPKALVDRAWHYMLYAHPHDSINGAMQDKSVLDVSHRLNQVVELSEALGNNAMQELVRRIDMSGFNEDDVLIAVFNPLPYERNEVVEAWVNMPDRMPRHKYWPPAEEGLQVFDADGNEMSTQWQARSAEAYCVWELHTRAFPYHCQRYLIYFDTGVIPACGYKIFRVAPLEVKHAANISWATSRACTGTLLKTPGVIENEFLKAEMNPNGSFNLTDKSLGRTFSNLNYYEDRGEHGDYWINERPMFDRIFNSLGSSAVIWCKESGPLQATLVSEITMRLPSRGIREQNRRGDELIDFVVRTEITLRAVAKQLEVKVDFENRHEDHCLRVMFPTGLQKATHADSGDQFFVNHRPIRAQGPVPDSVWPNMATLPQNGFVDVTDDKIGFAVINDSLMEYEVIDSEERTLALTLLRSVRNWFCTEHRVGTTYESQKGSQCLGRHSIRYAIRPHAGNWQDANLPHYADLFNVEPRLVQTRVHKGSLPAAQASLFSIDNVLLRFSALKKAEDRDTFVVRVYNPTGSSQEGRIKFSSPILKAWRTNLNEDRKDAIKVIDGASIKVKLDAFKISTIELKLSK